MVKATPKIFLNIRKAFALFVRQAANNDNTENQEQIAPVRINVPYVRGTSEQLKRIFNGHNINCTFYTTTTLRTLLSHAKDPVPSVQRNNVVYNIPAKTARLSILENQNEDLQRELKNTPEL